MRVRHPPITVAALLAMLATGCATNRDAKLQDQAQRIRRGDYLLSATNVAPGSFYELGVYVVGKGDTLSKIAQQFQVSVGDITAINPGLEPRRLVIGQRVKVYERRRG
jgi:LysM repeat protein